MMTASRNKLKNIILIAAFSIVCIAMIALYSLFTQDSGLGDTFLTEDSILFTPDDGEYTILQPRITASCSWRSAAVMIPIF